MMLMGQSSRKEEFDAVWEPYLATRQAEWNQAKLTFPVGKGVTGVTHTVTPKRPEADSETEKKVSKKGSDPSDRPTLGHFRS